MASKRKGGSEPPAKPPKNAMTRRGETHDLDTVDEQDELTSGEMELEDDVGEDDVGEDEEGEDDFEDYDLGEPPLPAAEIEADLNDPRVMNLPDAPLIGGRGRTRMLGQDVETVGAPSSPRLWAASARSPDVQRFYVYKVDPTSGAPHSIGTIAADCTEEGFIRHFYASMPRPTEGTAQFQLRPANAHGQEVGPIAVRHISPHHTALTQLREEEKAAMSGNGVPWQVNQTDGSAGVVAAELGEQLGQLNATMLEYHEQRLTEAQEAVERAREEARAAERKSAEERIALARDSSAIQQSTLDRMLKIEQERSAETIRTQKDSSQFMLQLLTGMSAQTRESLMEESRRRQEEAAARAERDRADEDRRAERERAYFERLHKEDQARRDRERADLEARWLREREAAKEEQLRREAELKTTLELARLDLEKKAQALKEEADRREKEAELRLRALETEREARDRRDREERESRERRDREEREAREKFERERFEREKAEERERRERERAEERERRDREAAREAALAAALREEREARERREEAARIAEREAQAARERLLAEERRLAAENAARQHELALASLKADRESMNARADREATIAREHAERLARIAAEDRAAAQLSEERRLAAEREDAAARERDRERAHKAEMERLERQHQAAQAHEARMFDLQKMQASGGGGLERLGDLAKTLGLEPTDALRKIFSAEEGMGETVFKGLGALAEAWLRSQQGRGPAPPVQQPPARQMVMIQTPEGPRQISMDAFRTMQAQQTQQTQTPPPGLVGPSPVVPPPTLPAQPPIPVRTSEEPQAAAPEPAQVDTASVASSTSKEPHPDFLAAKEVNVLTRSREAGISTKAAREARKFAKELIKKMAEADPATWSDLLGPALIGRVDFLTYLEAVTVWAAVVDTGADPALAEQVVAFIQAAEAELRSTFGRTEPMLPFNEADLLAFRARQPSPTPAPLTSSEESA